MADEEPREIEIEDSTQNTEEKKQASEKPRKVPGEETVRLTKFPLTRIKHMMKMDPDVTLASQESVYLISKATEMFVQHLSQYSYKYTSQSKRKTIQRKDVDSSVQALDEFAFLEGTFDY